MPGFSKIQILEYVSGICFLFSLFIRFIGFSYFPLAGGSYDLPILSRGGIRLSPCLVFGGISPSPSGLPRDGFSTLSQFSLHLWVVFSTSSVVFSTSSGVIHRLADVFIEATLVFAVSTCRALQRKCSLLYPLQLVFQNFCLHWRRACSRPFVPAMNSRRF